MTTKEKALQRRAWLIQKRKDMLAKSKPVEKEPEKEVVPISKINVEEMTDEELLDMAVNDERVTARKMAQKEIDAR